MTQLARKMVHLLIIMKTLFLMDYIIGFYNLVEHYLLFLSEIKSEYTIPIEKCCGSVSLSAHLKQYRTWRVIINTEEPECNNILLCWYLFIWSAHVSPRLFFLE